MLDVVRFDLGGKNATEEELMVAIWGFLCFLMIATVRAASWPSHVVFYGTDNQSSCGVG